MKQTAATKAKDIHRDWYIFDSKDQILGRQATKIAELLMGKHKPYFVRNLDCGDYVVVINARDVKVTGIKEESKAYMRHSGYPGGFKSETLMVLRARKPERIIERAVKGMLPSNRLGAQMLKRLYVFSGSDHLFTDKKFVNA